MSNNRKHLILLAIVVFISGTIICFCGNNRYHQAKAAGVLSMQECLGCHNGKMGKAITICIGDKCLLNKNHSLMSVYPPPGKEMSYASKSEVEQAGGFFENGKTTCMSCHNLTKPPPRLLREGDQLCVICHIDKKSLTR